MIAGTGMSWLGRLRRGWVWVALQFVLTLALLLAGLAWTRLPDKHFWQVALTLLVPLLLIVCALELQAGTVRALADDDGRRVKLIWGALALLFWIAVGVAFWALLDWCDDRIPLWAGYLNSRAGAHQRATVLTYEHIQRWLTELEWILRWVVLPAKLIPCGAAAAQWGWKIPWRRVMRLLWNWRWWVGVALASVFGVWIPDHFFDGLPKGTVSAQVWAVILKLIGGYVLAVGSWVCLLGWWAALFVERKAPPREEALVGARILTGPTLGSRAAEGEIPPAEDESD